MAFVLRPPNSEEPQRFRFFAYVGMPKIGVLGLFCLSDCPQVAQESNYDSHSLLGVRRTATGAEHTRDLETPIVLSITPQTSETPSLIVYTGP